MQNDGYHEYCTGGFDPDDIVVSGMGGRFPECENVQELKEALIEQKPLILYKKMRYGKGAAGIPYDSCGSILNIDKMDSEFFSYPFVMANMMDPGQRKHLEVVYETFCDAGYNPTDFKKANFGVYNAALSEDALTLSLNSDEGDGLLGLRSMNANRTSYVFDLTGPSYSLDSACSSSATAFWTAVNDLKANRIDGAIVSGIQLNFSPEFHYQYFRTGVCSLAGNSIPFDANTDGMMRCECISALFLQKAKFARRVYATVASTRFFSSGYYQEGISVPSRKGQLQAFKETLEEAGLSTEDIQYVEAHGTGTQVGDPIELNSLAEGYHKGRNDPLYVGSIKSNIGHTEASSGICGYMKAILCFETGNILPNLRYSVPNPQCLDLVYGKLKIPMELIPLKSTHIPVNSFGLGGTISTTLLKHNPKTYSSTKPQSGPLPRVVFFPGTTEEAVEVVFDYVKKRPDLRPEFFALLNKLPFTPTFQKPIRGYAIYKDWENPTIHISKLSDAKKREVWFIMTGMGSQWPGMGLQLMNIDVFANSMKRSAAVVKPLGIDLFEVLRADKNYFNMQRNITPTFVALAAIQIALIDILRQLKIKPDGMIGHSAGELLCAYADECCTLEEAILFAYWRGKSVDITNLPEGNMAAVGLSWEEAKRRCPADIYPACDNASDSVTISGPTQSLDKFVEELKKDNIFARTVNTAGYAFHSKYIEPAAGVLLRELKKVITNPRPRSASWISTSYTGDECNLEESKFFSADYYCHNLLSTVRFTEAVMQIPKNAITIEIGPHYLLQSLLKRTIGPAATYLGLMKRNDPDNVMFLMESLGKLYTEGASPQIERLYPPVQFPVPRSTPMINNLIRWNHSQTFHVPVWKPPSVQFIREVKLDREESYILDHFIDGRPLFPATGYVFLAWEALAHKRDKNHLEMSISVENFKIFRATILNPATTPKFNVNILESTGTFEISEGGSLVASGIIQEVKNMAFSESEPTHTYLETAISGKDLYDELKMNGYEYGPAFQNITEISVEGTEGFVSWDGRWISFLDSLLLFFGLVENSTYFRLPTGALFFKIDPKQLQNLKNNKNFFSEKIPVTFNPNTLTCRSFGVEIGNLALDQAPHRGKDMKPTLENYTFVPNFSTYVPDKKTNERLSKYMILCNKAIDKISKSIRKDFANYKFPIANCSADDSVEENTDGHVLLDILEEISQNKELIHSKKKETFASYSQNMGRDILNNILLNEDSVKLILDLILENCFKKINALEINAGFSPILLEVAETMKKYSHGNIKNKTILTNSQIPVDKELLQENKIKLQPLDTLKSFEDHPEDLVVGSFSFGSKNDLEQHIHSLGSVIKSNGFILLFNKEGMSPAEKLLSFLTGEEFQIHPQNVIEKIFAKEKLTVISKIDYDYGNSLYLLRPLLSSPPAHTIVRIKDGTYQWVEEVKDLVSTTEDNVWLVSENTDTSGIIGMVNCLKQEPFGERIRCIFLPDKKSKEAPFDFKDSSYAPLIQKDMLMNVRKNGIWGTFRHLVIREGKQPRDTDQSLLVQNRIGDLSSFAWQENPLKYRDIKGNYERIAHVYYAALNFRDVMMTTGKITLTQDEPFGFEFCGRTPDGRRIAASALGSCMATTVCYDERTSFELPDNWSMEEGATVMIVYFTCYYSLLIRGQLQKGESILIHSGTGGVGQAAIRIALSLNCEIFTTVGNEEKKKYLKKLFPQIKDENIGCSRNISFENMIMNRTKGRGVDVVLNSLADEKLQASLRCVACSGRFIEIGKYDSQLDRPLGMKIFLKNVSVIGVHVDEFSKKNKLTSWDIETVAAIMSHLSKGIKEGVVQPLDRTVFSKNEVEQAFRYMAKGIHVGKLMIKMRDEEPQKKIVPKSLTMPAIPQTYFYEHKVYIIIGGLGGFGIEVAKWILKRGGRHVILTSRYGLRLPYHHLCLRRWKSDGYDVRVSTLNVVMKEEAEQLIQEALQIGPVGGIFNSAVVLKDAFMDAQTVQSYEDVCAPKEIASRNLDEITRMLCPDLDYFVCFSSISCGRGNAGQTNYGYANSAMERICEKRKSLGLHGLAIQWGIIGGVGVVHRHMGDDAKISGVVAQSVQSCLDALNTFMTLPHPVVSSYVTAVEVKQGTSSNEVLSHISKVLGVSSVDEINTTRSFGEMGIDSMLGVELKQLLETACDVTVSFQEIQEMRIDDIKAMLEKAQSEKAPGNETGEPALLSTVSINLPPTLRHLQPLQVVGSGDTGTPLFILYFGDNDAIQDFKVLSEELARPVYALRWTKETAMDKIEDVAQWYLNIIKEKVNGPFQLLGYGMSGTFALQMALQSDDVKNIMLLDGSEEIRRRFEKTDGRHEDTFVIMSFLDQFMPYNPQMEQALQQIVNFEQRVDVVWHCLQAASRTSLNKEELIEAINLHNTKVHLVINYILGSKIAKNAILIENPNKVFANDVTEIIRQFSKVTSGKIKVHRSFEPSELMNKESMKKLASILNAEL